MSQSLAQIYVHVVFSTKRREPLLRDKDLRLAVFTHLPHVMGNLDFSVEICNGCEDHVHLLGTLSKNAMLAKVIGESKRVTSLWVKKHFGVNDFAWQNGYGAFSVSYSMVERVCEYIRSQEEHHRTVSFQDELRKFLQLNKIPFDERFIWD